MSDARPAKWRRTEFMKLWTSLMGVDLGGSVTALAVPLLVYDLFGVGAVGPAVAAGSIGSLLVLTVVGGLIDGLSSRIVMMVCLVLRALGCGAMVLLLSVGSLQLWSLLLICAVLGATSSAFRPAEVSAVRSVVLPGLLPQAFAANHTRSSIARVAGGGLAGVLYGVGRPFAWVLDLVCSAGAFVGILTLRSDVGSRTSSGTAMKGLLTGVRFVLSSKLLKFTVPIAMVMNFAAYWPAAVVVLREGGLSSQVVGLVSMAVSVSGIIGALSSGWIVRVVSAERAMLGSVALLLCCFIIMAIAPSPWIFIAAVLLATAVVAPIGVVCAVGEAAATPMEYAGRVNSAVKLVSMLVMPVGQIAGTFVLDRYGTGATFLMFGIAVALGLCLVLHAVFIARMKFSAQ